MVVFVIPLYYFGMSAQLKMVIDRCCSFNGTLTEKRLKAALITASYDNNLRQSGHDYERWRRYRTNDREYEISTNGIRVWKSSINVLFSTSVLCS